MLQIHSPNTIALPITQSMLEVAFNVANEQQTVDKRKEVFNNTLAIQVVHSYLQMLAVNCELTSSDSWNPLLRHFSNMADLQLGELGHLECRPVDPQTLECILPDDLAEDRVGVIPVKLDLESNQAQLLGFTQHVAPGAKIKPAQLQSLDQFFEYIEACSTSQSILLRQWLEGLFEAGWQQAESLVGNQRYALAHGFMGDPIPLQIPTSGAKLIDLGMELGHQSVVLLLGVTVLEEEKVEIRAQLHPNQEDQYLPSNVKLELLSDSGESLRSVKTRQFDNLIQLPRFQCNPGEEFRMQVSNDDIQITETFMV